MTEKELQLLGFTREDEQGIACSDDQGNHWTEDDYHYYVYEVTDGLTFMTAASDEVKDDNWFVEVFNTDEPIRFWDFGEVQGLINLLEKAKVKTA